MRRSVVQRHVEMEGSRAGDGARSKVVGRGQLKLAALRAAGLTRPLILRRGRSLRRLVYLGVELCHGGFASEDTAVQSVQQLNEARGKRFREIVPLAQGRPELGPDGRGIWGRSEILVSLHCGTVNRREAEQDGNAAPIR